MSKRKKKTESGSVITMRFFIRIATYAVAITAAIIVCTVSWNFGKEIFRSEGMAENGKGEDIVITIPAGSTTSEIASILKKNGLIESELAFLVQTYMYEAEIYSGTYTLNTSYNPEELIEALSAEETE